MNSSETLFKSRETCRVFALLMVLLSGVVAQADSIPDMKIIEGKIRLPDVESYSCSPDTLKTCAVSSDLPLPSHIASQINIYDMPYSRDASYRNWNRLWLNTGVLYGAGVVALGVLESLPDDATNWNREELRQTPWIQRWGNHVAKVAHWDGDSPFFNYVLHPYGGAAYFMSARSQGFSFWGSSLYCFCVSTFFWEYGIEAFMEIPSIQDLVITPVVGSLIGECFYKWKRNIVANGYTLCGSSLLGNVVAFLIDPVNEFIGLFAGNPCRQGLKQKRTHTELACVPMVQPSRSGISYGFSLALTF